jgi:hypothetical protein
MSPPVGEPLSNSKNPKELLRSLATPELLACLDDLFPDRLPQTMVDLPTLGRLLGQRDVVNCIKAALEEVAKRQLQGSIIKP